VDDLLAKVTDAAGPDRVKLVHANDSLLGCGSRRDRHEGIGKGMVGPGPFRVMLAHPLLADVPFVVETPGGREGHARDVAALKDLRDRPPGLGEDQHDPERARRLASPDTLARD
jgi:deoxyribonuclease-4